jgi:hypothetical protein
MNVRKYTGAMTIGWLYVNCLPAYPIGKNIQIKSYF